MAWELAATTRNAGLDAIVDLVDGGSGAGKMQIRTGSKPGVGNAASGTLLVTVTFADPAFGSASSGSATLTDPASVNAVASGTAGHVRILDSANNVVMDGTVTSTGGGGDVTLSSTSITSGLPVDITGGSLTLPAGG